MFLETSETSPIWIVGLSLSPSPRAFMAHAGSLAPAMAIGPCRGAVGPVALGQVAQLETETGRWGNRWFNQLVEPEDGDISGIQPIWTNIGGAIMLWEWGLKKLFYLLHDKKWAICHCLFSGQSLQKIRDTPPYGLANRVPFCVFEVPQSRLCWYIQHLSLFRQCPAPKPLCLHHNSGKASLNHTLNGIPTPIQLICLKIGCSTPAIHWLIIILLIITVKLPFSGVYTPFPDPISSHFHSLNPCEWFKSC